MLDKDYHYSSLKLAFSGLVHAFTRHHNFKIHAFIAACVLLLSWYFAISRIELLIVILTIVVGFTVEFLNTAVESVCDLVTTDWRKDIKNAKDMGAAMMLVASLGSIVVGLIIFYPYFADFLN